MATINLSTRAGESTRADALVVGVVKRGDDVELVSTLDGAADALRTRLRALKATGDRGEVVTLLSDGLVTAPVVAAVGLGEPDDDHPVDEDALRLATGAAVRALGKHRHVAVALPATEVSQVRAVAEGAQLGAYVFNRYLATKRPAVTTVTVLSPLGRQSAARKELADADTVATATNLARDLVNAPPNDLYPASFVSEVRRTARGRPVRVTALDEAQLARKGYGGILGVGQGSSRPPRLLRMAYRPADPTAHLAFVGKGITFDSGGYTIKPGPAMVTMKSDMAGAAAVVFATLAIAELGLPVAVTAYACLAENMVSGDAVRPDDVITMFGGQTVEITNTDAEGRLVLADGIATANGDRPDAIVDVATLTGNIVGALGHRMGGVFGNDGALSADIVAAACRCGEQLCAMPIPDEMREKARGSRIADLSQHHGERAGGTVFAAAFLREFVDEGIPWAHLDIAGPAFNEGPPHGYTPSGATGMGVRTLVQLARDRA